MGSFVFKWEHPASEVYVTGTFDDWSKSEKLEKVGDVFSKDVTLSSADKKIYYKFVVDGNWVTDHTAPQEDDAAGNLNNVLTTDRIVKHTPATAGIMSGTSTSSTVAALAGQQPLEKAGSSEIPGSFPETPALNDKAEFSVNPLPATSGGANPISLAPGEKVPHPSEFTSNTIQSGVYDDPELVAADKAKNESEATFGVAPLPAFPGGVNPVKTAPGEPLPATESLTGHTLTSNVRTDKASYENSGGLGTGPEGAYDAANPTIQSSGAGSTTAQLAGAVPLESSKVPEVVKESQAEAGVDAEASGVPAEVKEKSAVESELLKEVPTAPSTSEGTGGKETADKSEKPLTTQATETAAAVGAAALAAGGAAYAYATGAAQNATSKLPEGVQNTINNVTGTSTGATSVAPETTAKDTPEVVKESIAASGQAPEAAGNEEAVLEKKAMEDQLLSKVKPENATGESAPAVAPSTTSLAVPAPPKEPESRDVSPGTIPGSHAPTVTTGVGAATTSTVTGPSSKTPQSPAGSSATDKKKKRTSIFGKIKAKFEHKKESS